VKNPKHSVLLSFLGILGGGGQGNNTFCIFSKFSNYKFF
jgi:hypothetical protein